MSPSKTHADATVSSPPTVSVVLPFHNAADTLHASIESIRAQTFTGWELLLYDDGSGDGSAHIAEEFAAHDARVRIVGRQRVGIVGALQRACHEASGEFIARMDADDISHPARFEKQLAAMRLPERPALCGCLVRSVGADLGEGGQRYHEWINALTDHESMCRELFVECPIAHPTFMVRRDAFLRIGGYEDHGWAEDYDFVLRLWAAGERLAKVPDVLLDWRHTPGRLSLSDPRYTLERFRALKRHYLDRSVLPMLGSRTFIQWGAGEVGKRWLREWRAVRPAAVVDIHPRKIGTKIHGYRVIAPDELPPPGQTFVLLPVVGPGARDEIRAWLTPRGYREVEDYRFIA